MRGSWLRQRLAAHTALRLVVATALLGLAVVVQVRAPGALPFNPFFALIGATFAISVALLGALRFVDRLPWMADVHFALDAVLISAGVYLTGGVNSLFTTLYALPILSASTVHRRQGGLRIATVNAVLFLGLVAAQYAAARSGIELPFLPDRAALPAPTVAIYILGLNLFGFYAVAMLSGSLADRAQRADVRLERATEEIADLQAFNQYVIDNLLSGLATADAGNRLLTFNRSAMAITGLETPPLGRDAAAVLQLDPDAAGTLLDDLARTRSRRLDYQFRRADGRAIDIGLSVARLPLPDGGHGYLYTFQDVTEMKRFERNARLQQRLAAVGEMAAGIAHEIRNPLASMSGSMQMLRQELALSGDQAQLMDIVLKESDRLNQTIKSFLAYARPHKAERRRLDLGTLVQETALLLRNSPEVGDHHAIAVSPAERPVEVEGDEGQLRQILWNLATNGLKAMPDGGELGLAVRYEPAGPDGAPLALLEVTDHGTGMSADELESVFQPFRGSFSRGTGLGLAIVHRLVSDSGGRIDVQSEPGRGTTFMVRLPALRPADAAGTGAGRLRPVPAEARSA